MKVIDFVVIDGIAVGMLIAEGGLQRFCGSSQALACLEDQAFADVAEAQSYILGWLQNSRAPSNNLL